VYCSFRLLDYVLAALNLPKEQDFSPKLDKLSSIEVPIHPKIAEQLGITWVEDALLYWVWLTCEATSLV
jgi:hypothetical protein